MNRKWLQYGFYFVGIMILVVGVVILSKVNLGMAPYDGLVLNTSIALNQSYGLVNVTFGAIFVLAQIVILRKEFKLKSLIQFLMVIYISVIMNFFMYTVFAGEFSSDLAIRIPLFGIGTVLAALGIAMFMAAGLYSFPLETLIGIIYDKFKIRIVITKWVLDAMFLIISFFVASAGGLVQNNIGLGTIINFIVTSPLINFFYDIFVKRLEKLPNETTSKS